MLEIVGNRLIGQIAQAIVVTVVADMSSQFGLRAQRIFPLVGKQAIEFRPPRFQTLFGSVSKQGNEKNPSEHK